MSEPPQSIKKITFTLEQTRLAEYKASRLGLNFQEYIKHLVAKDTEDILGRFTILNVDEAEEIENGIDQSKHLKFTISKHKRELKSLLENWIRDGF